MVCVYVCIHNEKISSTNVYCDQLTYFFSFWYIISAYIVAGLAFGFLLSCCAIGYLIQKHAKNEMNFNQV